ncbi:TIGR02391 family protein [Kaistia algarum]|uniref:TIGR02391 family protein n=1 Tax=Kaistia algarum TaxID=2083279 RepID=UPI000CE87220|nr:TIGR02391 family protein [Kaistia algarum]MCX5515276.1 TIGR02391 family protein [Kaistia algarum]PPE77707.1 TIGR02391 family protein [Kaistia algarum]
MKKSRDPARQPAQLSPVQMQAALPRLEKRLSELKAVNIGQLDEETGAHILDSLCMKFNTSLRDIFGDNTIEFFENSVDTFQPTFGGYYPGMDTSLLGNLDKVRKRIGSAITTLQTLIELFTETLSGASDGVMQAGVLRAYEGLELHPEIARAASRLYKDGHYANAVEAAVKALNGLVRLRSQLEQDGTSLMERAFSLSNPVLKFNALVDQSDKDEQKGFMQLFSGAVSGLRNPRAHGFIQDEPERALEFIAFVSLLAKLLDEATT